MKTRTRLIRRSAGLAFAAALAVTASACNGSSTSSQGSKSASFAGLVGEPANYFFPMYDVAHWDTGYVPWASYLSWRPLYWWGNGNKPVFNAKLSLANSPKITTNSAGHTVIDMTLKKLKWSDGKPLTTRDVEFWLNLLRANKTKWAPYAPGGLADIIQSVDYVSKTEFRLTLNNYYNSYWLLGNELDQITPIPQHAWDKTSQNGSIDNYDRTPAGAKAVYTYLQKQAKKPKTFDSNPLWQVVDGPWKIKTYNLTNSQVTYTRNAKYAQAPKGGIQEFTNVPYTSDSAEFNALLSGSVDVGYVPFSSLKSIPRLKKNGYKIANWDQVGYGGIILQYAKDNEASRILKQLYVRQALTHMLDMKSIIKDVWNGHAAYLPQAVPAGAPLTSKAKSDPYPYSVSKAKSILAEHGWTTGAGGVATCTRPGTAANECGSGIAAGTPLKFKFMATQSTNAAANLLQYVKSAFSKAGVDLEVNTVPDSDLSGKGGACVNSSKCSWDMELWMGYWPLGWTTNVSTGESTFLCKSSSNFANLCDPKNDALIKANSTSHDPNKALKQWEDYMTDQQFMIFLPMPAFRVVAYKNNMTGVTPTDPYLQIYPENWKFGK